MNGLSKIIKFALFAVFVATLSLTTLSVLSTPSFQVQADDISDYQSEIDKKNKEKAEKERILNQTKADIDKIAQSGASLDQKIAMLNEKLSKIESDIKKTENELLAKEKELNTKLEALKTKSQEISDISSSLYKSSKYGIIETVLSNTDSQDLFRSINYRKYSIDNQVVSLKGISLEYQSLNEAKQDIEFRKEILAQEKSALEESKSAYNNEKARIRQEMNNKIALQNALSKQIVSLNKDLNGLNSSLQAAIQAKLSQNTDTTGGGTTSGGTSPQPVSGNGGKYDIYVDGTKIASEASGPIRVVSNSAGTSGTNVFRINGSTYFRGILEFRADTNVYLINELPIEMYMRGIGEVPSSWPMEALKTQVVAARSYAITNFNKRLSYKYNLRDDPWDQNYTGYGKESASYGGQWVEAVNQTTGKVVMYGGKAIPAYYHSTCGGHTLASEEVWVSALPYTKAESDWYMSGGTIKSYDADSPWSYKKWGTETNDMVDLLNATLYLAGSPNSSTRQAEIKRWDYPGGLNPSQIVAKLGSSNTITAKVGTITDLKAIYNNGTTEIALNTRKTDTLRVTGTEGSIDISAKTFWIVYNARAAGKNALYSTLWSVVKNGNSWDFYSRGYPHRVGMCQYGSYGRAKAGQNYTQILQAYFRGTTVGNHTISSPIRIGITRVATGDVYVASSQGGDYSVFANGTKLMSLPQSSSLRIVKK